MSFSEISKAFSTAYFLSSASPFLISMLIASFACCLILSAISSASCKAFSLSNFAVCSVIFTLSSNLNLLFEI